MDVWDATLSALFLALIFLATLILRDRRRLSGWMSYGALWAIGTLVSPSLLSLLPFFLGWLAWEKRKQSSRWLAPVAAVVLVFLLGIAPWTLRNYRAMGKFIPLRSNFGLELWLGNNPDAADVNSFSMHPLWNAAEADSYQRLGETAYMEAKRREALTFIRSHPSETFGSIVHRFETYWFAVSDRPASRPLDSLSLRAFSAVNALLMVISWLGAGIAYYRRIPEAGPYLLLLLIYPLVFYLTHTLVRYRFPMDPILTILAVYGMACTWAWVHKPLQGDAWL